MHYGMPNYCYLIYKHMCKQKLQLHFYYTIVNPMHGRAAHIQFNKFLVVGLLHNYICQLWLPQFYSSSYIASQLYNQLSISILEVVQNYRNTCIIIIIYLSIYLPNQQLAIQLYMQLVPCSYIIWHTCNCISVHYILLSSSYSGYIVN